MYFAVDRFYGSISTGGTEMRVYIDGEVLAEPDAKVSVFDHGLGTGDGAFETLAVYQGQVFATSRHLARLERTCKGMRLEEKRYPVREFPASKGMTLPQWLR